MGSPPPLSPKSASPRALSPAALAIVARLSGAEALEELSRRPGTLFHGAPGVLFVLEQLRPWGPHEALFGALWDALCGLLPTLSDPRALGGPAPESFLLGQGGLDWARAAAAGSPQVDLAPPRDPRGFDAFANDSHRLFLGLATTPSPGAAEALPVAAWARLIGEEVAAMEAALKGPDPVLLGFAHGVAGCLYRALRIFARDPQRAPLGRARLREALGWLGDQALPAGEGLIWPTFSGRPVSPEDPFVGSLCNGAVGHGILFLDAAQALEDPGLLQVAYGALGGIPPVESLPLSVCCGHGGQVALVSRFLRLGCILPEAARGSWAQLLARIPLEAETAPLSAISGLASCLPAAMAEGPASSRLDYLLPTPLERP